jgi:DNA-binding NarL/FixJ family response regulator
VTSPVGCEPGGGAPIRVLLADDQALLRAGFALLVDAEPGMVVVGEAADGARAVELAHELLPDVVLMDVRMPGTDGIEATRLIRSSARTAGVRVLVLTMFDLDEHVFGALRAGACGFLLKDTPPAELLAGLRIVARGEGLLAPGPTRRLIEAFAGRARAQQGGRPGAVLPGVTDREREVLALVARGLSNAQIAERLRVSVPTVKTHVSRLLDKLGARDRTQLVVTAYETGLVVPGDG